MNETLSPRARWAILFTAIASLLFDGVELGLMPVASLSVSESLLGRDFTPALGGSWFARFTGSLMLGAAIGGILLGQLGDLIGRTRALGISVLFYSGFAGLGCLVQTQEQMFALRFLVGLGVGGVWPNAIALAAECWPERSKPTIAGLMGAALNGGILLLSQVARLWPITADSWRWIFAFAALPLALGLLALFAIPESLAWKQSRKARSEEEANQTRKNLALRELVLGSFWPITLFGSLLGSIPLVGAWAASKWMIPWADAVTRTIQPDYKAIAQGWWALGAVIGSFLGGQCAKALGPRLSYALMCLATTAVTATLFLASRPMEASFLPLVFVQGTIATLFFGWLPLFLPALFPTHLRATGTGISYNIGRFATAAGVFLAGTLFDLLGGSYPLVGSISALVYLLGIPVIALGPPIFLKKD